MNAPTAARLALAAAILLAPSLVAAQDASGASHVTLFGQVVDFDSRRPIPYATVQLPDRRTGVIADSMGRWSVPRVPAGRQVITASQLGYAPAEVEWEVVAENPPVLVQLVESPVVFEAVEAAVDRLDRRRRAYPRSLELLDRRQLSNALGMSAHDVVRVRGGIAVTNCPPFGYGSCIMHRGRPVQPEIVIDEHPAWDGLHALRNLQPHEIYAIEILGRGRQIRVYTMWYMDGAGRRHGGLQPLPIY